MGIQESGEMYLETILVLMQTNQHIRSIDICEYMEFSKPSVSRAVSLLKNNGYIEVDASGYITLTQEGYAIAKKIYERHKILTDLLVTLGVDEKTAAQDACKIEHDISDESFAALKEHLSKEHL